MSGTSDLKKIIAGVNPGLYTTGNKKQIKKFKKLIEEHGISDAWEEAKDISELKDLKAKPLSSYKLTYDAPSAQLEPIYFWLLDFMAKFARDGIEKITDNFMSSPGSGHFQDMSQRQSKLRQEAMTTLGGINQIIKTAINILYDLKEFELRLGNYEDANSKNPEKKNSGLLALKQIWLDNVDMKKGNTSIKGMAFSQASFATLIDAFMIVKDSGGNEIDLNDRVKRILKQRIAEFNHWKGLSERELKKRFEVQKAYLRTQVETLKLYTAWIRPYLKSAEQLRMKGFDNDPAMVNAFSTSMFELILLGKSKTDYKSAAKAGNMPKSFANYKSKRDYYSCFVISFTFRGHVAQKVTPRGDYGFGIGGKVDMVFDCYALNKEELELIKSAREKQDIKDTLSFAQNSTDQSLEQLQEDFDHFLNDKEKEEEKEEKKKQDDINPFSALLGLFKFAKKDKKKDKELKQITELKQIKSENFIEKEIRKLASITAIRDMYSIYDIYKKAHGMASSVEPFQNFENQFDKYMA